MIRLMIQVKPASKLNRIDAMTNTDECTLPDELQQLCESLAILKPAS